jgi:hypothetical protein
MQVAVVKIMTKVFKQTMTRKLAAYGEFYQYYVEWHFLFAAYILHHAKKLDF